MYVIKRHNAKCVCVPAHVRKLTIFCDTNSVTLTMHMCTLLLEIWFYKVYGLLTAYLLCMFAAWRLHYKFFFIFT